MKPPRLEIQVTYRLTLDNRDLGLFTVHELISMHERINALLSAENHKGDPALAPKHFSRFLPIFCNEADTPAAGLLARGRRRRESLTRQVAMVLARELLPDATLESVGAAFNRDHGTVLHAIRAVKNRADTDPAWAEELESLRARIKARFIPASVDSVPSC